MPEGKQDYLKLGDWNARCDSCTFKFKFSELRKDWKGLFKCSDCWESRHPMDLQQPPRPSTPIPVSRPDKDIKADGTPVLYTSIAVNVLVETTVPTGTMNGGGTLSPL